MSELLHKEYEGAKFKFADWWQSFSPMDYYLQLPIKYLEIGTFHGANLFSVANSYASHENSELYCVDPWLDYGDYPEYKTLQETNYEQFMKNLDCFPEKHKIHVRRGFSDKEIPKFEDEFFDIIYIDGNHEPEFVLEDAVLSFRKLKQYGVMIFDDYTWGGPDMTQRGIDGFIHGYHKRLNVLGVFGDQMYVQKISSHK